MVIGGLAYALNEIIDSYPASDDHSFGHQMKVTFTITGFIFGGPLLFHLVDRIPTLGKSDLSAASLRYTIISLFLYISHISIFHEYISTPCFSIGLECTITLVKLHY